MKPVLLAFIYLTSLLVAGCTSTPSADAKAYVGEYVFAPYFSDPGRFADVVILKADATAVEIRVSKRTQEVTTQSVPWHLSNLDDKHHISLNGYSHPVELSGGRIRLVINGDLGLYYEKVR